MVHHYLSRPAPAMRLFLASCALLCGASALLHTTPHRRAAPRTLRPRAATLDGSSVSALPETLSKLVAAMAGLPDDKYRYKQLLFWAAEAPDLAATDKVDANRVPGCLSTVHVTAALDGDGRVVLAGDSDAQLTKGLVVLLVKGLSGATVEEICAVEPSFIQDAGIAASLTPGRNNGFVNMLNVIKAKARALGGGDAPAATAVPVPVPADGAAGPVAAALREKLAMLQPTSVAVVDESGGRETSFALDVVADCFAGLAPEKREALVATIVADVGVEGLAITARTADEAA